MPTKARLLFISMPGSHSIFLSAKINIDTILPPTHMTHKQPFPYFSWPACFMCLPLSSAFYISRPSLPRFLQPTSYYADTQYRIIVTFPPAGYHL